jgi:glutamyl-tRNA synthetase
VTRLAPSPTGTLHLGNALTFVVNWALARRLGWRVVLRMEDLDAGRVREGAAEEAVAILRWLGLDWDEGPVVQSADLSPYREALERLRDRGQIYPCSATRKEIERAASAPHESDGETRYPGINRPMGGRYRVTEVTPPVLVADAYAWRLIVPDGPVDFVDALHGPQSIDVQGQVGDFAVATKAGLPAYQLAVVVDDARQGVTDVVRGDDLLTSTPRQVLLYRVLGLGDPPRYWHLPLVAGPDGRRMAKRDDAVRLTTYLDAGVPGERVVGLLARWTGLADDREVVSAEAFAQRLDPDRLAYDAPRFTEEDEQWLMDGKA